VLCGTPVGRSADAVATPQTIVTLAHTAANAYANALTPCDTDPPP
jgi:hypothetical protein